LRRALSTRSLFSEREVKGSRMPRPPKPNAYVAFCRECRNRPEWRHSGMNRRPVMEQSRVLGALYRKYRSGGGTTYTLFENKPLTRPTPTQVTGYVQEITPKLLLAQGPALLATRVQENPIGRVVLGDRNPVVSGTQKNVLFDLTDQQRQNMQSSLRPEQGAIDIPVIDQSVATRSQTHHGFVFLKKQESANGQYVLRYVDNQDGNQASYGLFLLFKDPVISKPESPSHSDPFRLLVTKCYIEPYYPPDWTWTNTTIDFGQFHASAQVYYACELPVDVKDVMRLVREREPTNIAMQRLYNKTALKELFGYETGCYGEMYQKYNHPVHMALYCQTPFFKSQPRSGGSARIAHVINLIGLAFDDPRQPDYKYYVRFAKDNRLIKEHLTTAMVRVYRFAFQAAKERDLHLALSPIGDVSFRPRFVDEFASDETGPEAFRQQVLRPAWEHLKTEFNHEVKTSEHLFPKFQVPTSLHEFDLQNTLFCNAWDCWSMLGNGNSSDNSMDGYWGRSSAIARIGWPVSNPALQNEDKYTQVDGATWRNFQAPARRNVQVPENKVNKKPTRHCCSEHW